MPISELIKKRVVHLPHYPDVQLDIVTKAIKDGIEGDKAWAVLIELKEAIPTEPICTTKLYKTLK